MQDTTKEGTPRRNELFRAIIRLRETGTGALEIAREPRGETNLKPILSEHKMCLDVVLH